MKLRPTKKVWKIRTKIPPEVERRLSEYPPAISQLLYNRGIEDAKQADIFLRPGRPEGADPFLLLGMETAVARIGTALERDELMAVYGDYDVDGLTATALMVDSLTQLGGRVLHYIPNRFDEGYGLNSEALQSLHSSGVSLAISVDCGIRSVAEAEYASQIGLDLIITDHHYPGEVIPPALAVINQNLEGDPYPFNNLAGVGIAYKLSCALASVFHTSDLRPEEYFDLVALGTVADIAPLIGENRALVRAGLERLSPPRRQGLVALQGVAGLLGKQIQAQDIGFILGPRLNAAGRLDSAEKAFRLLTTTDRDEAARVAQELDDQNRARQEITRQTQAQVEGRLGDESHLLIADADERYNQGIVGLVASRLVNKYYRPVLLGYRGDSLTTGSCRSIPEFHIAEALDRCEDLLIRYGGHAAAAGFTVSNERWEELVDRLQGDLIAHLKSLSTQELTELKLNDLELADRLLRPSLIADLEIPINEVGWDLLEAVRQFQPTGHENPEPVFVSRNLKIGGARVIGRDSAHLKLKVRDGSRTFEAIAFRMGAMYGSLGSTIDLAYTLEANEYMGETKLQLNVMDIRPIS
jgi:single-stranded-DNA-specific exonuclease